ncbi:hypothetical protein MCOR25_001729 [Pyricularia grisea]|nr:hypothetical protein MCOR25_001729 [Pyricularia grisea]
MQVARHNTSPTSSQRFWALNPDAVAQMRLIDTNTVEVVEFYDDEIPQYAILSHTWGTEEVSYQDMQFLTTDRNRKVRDLSGSHSSSLKSSDVTTIVAMSGYIKIKTASNYARSHGLRYLWVDTCCIDKTSSAELSEAINSMFAWYRDAALCFAYLEDVPSRQLRDSRWFTRGWTLQELIAPREMVFCSSDWNEVGKKSSSEFCELLANITGVDGRVLRGNINLDEISVANRMRWAVNRKTTRREDMAYCLMGIFSVNMPLLYEEIMRETDDHSIFAWAAQPGSNNPLHGLLASSPAAFANTQTIRCLPPLQTSDSVPMGMTNQGLRLKVFLLSVPEYREDVTRYLPQDFVVTSADPLPPDGYFAFLECSVIENGEFLCPVILLRNLWGDQYARINIDRVYHLRDPRTYYLDLPDSDYCPIYVKQKPREILPDFIVALEKGLGSCDDRITFVEQALPPESWDPASFVLTPRPVGPLNTTVAAIRFSDSARKSCLDVFVGLTKVGHGWVPWCIQSHDVSCSLWNVYEELVDALGHSVMPRQEWKPGPIGTMAQTRLTTRYGRPFVLLEFVQKFEIDGTEIFQPEDNVKTSIQPGIDIQPLPSLGPEVSGPQENQALSAVPAQEAHAERASSDMSRLLGSIRRYELNDMQVNDSDAPHYTDVQEILASCSIVDSFETSVSVEQPFFKVRTGSRYWPLQEINRVVRAAAKTVLPELVGWLGVIDAAGFLEGINRASEDGLRQIVHESQKHLPWFSELHLAFMVGSLKLFDRYISEDMHGSQLQNMKGDGGLSFYHFAAMRWRPVQVGLLRHAMTTAESGLSGSNVILANFSILHSNRNRTPISQIVVERIAGLQLSPTQETPLHFAAAYGAQDNKTNIIRLLLGDLYQNGLLIAPDKLKQLLQAHNYQGETPLHRACAMGNIAMAKTILDLDPGSAAKPDKRGLSVLWHAACGGNASMIRLLLCNGAAIETACKDGRTPMHVVCREGHSNAVEVLLQFGAKADAKALGFGLTPAHLAAMFGHHKCLKRIIRHANDAVDKSLEGRKMNCTPLHLAVANGHTKCVKVLLEAGVDISRPCECYFLCLSAAHSTKKPESFDVVATNEMPEYIATERGFDQIAEMIALRRGESAQSHLIPEDMSFEHGENPVVRSI